MATHRHHLADDRDASTRHARTSHATWRSSAMRWLIAAHAAAVLAACGGGGDDSQQEPPPSSMSTEDVAVAAEPETSEPSTAEADSIEPESAAQLSVAPPEDFGPRLLGRVRPDAAWSDGVDARQPKADASAAPPHPVLGAHTWAWRPSAAARCGNGTTTGYAINVQPGSDTLLLYLQGGGACWGATTCFGVKTSKAFLETKSEAAVRAEVADARMAVLFDRGREGSLFADMTHAYVPYCTGDLHVGTRATTHKYLFRNRPAHHVGALNLDAFLADMVPLMAPSVRRVVLVGASAGGFGASMNWWRVREAFGAQVRVDVLNDSGPMIDPSLLTVWRDMRNTWGLRTPPGCTDCGDAPSKWLPFYARTIAAPERYAVIAHEGDDVIGLYTLASDRQQARRLVAMRDAMAPNQRAFLLPGDAHVQLDDDVTVAVGGVTLGTWVTRFLRQDPAWQHAGP
jgi:hypothetical protein